MGSKTWTRNYDNLFSSLFGCIDATGSASSPSYDKPLLRDVDGNWRGVYSTYELGALNSHALCLPQINKYGTCGSHTITGSNTDMPNIGIQLGSGVGVATIDDYQLFLPISSNFTINKVSQSWTYNNEAHSYTKTFVVPFLYSGDTPITVTEFGLFTDLWDNWNTTYPVSKGYMLYHEFLDNSVTLTKNDTIEITFGQTIVQPNYTPYPEV